MAPAEPAPDDVMTVAQASTRSPRRIEWRERVRGEALAPAPADTWIVANAITGTWASGR